MTCVRLCVCLVHEHISETTLPVQVFCACYLWPWLSYAVAALQCVIYLLPFSWVTSCLHIMAINRRREKGTYLSDSTGEQHGFDTAAYSQTEPSVAALDQVGV